MVRVLLAGAYSFAVMTTLLLFAIMLGFMMPGVDGTAQFLAPGIPTPVYHRGMKTASPPPHEPEIKISEPAEETFHADVKPKNKDEEDKVYPIDAEIKEENFFSKKWTVQHRRDLMKRMDEKRSFSPDKRFCVLAKGKKPFERR
jgi:hypothetical protein